MQNLHSSSDQPSKLSQLDVPCQLNSSFLTGQSNNESLFNNKQQEKQHLSQQQQQQQHVNQQQLQQHVNQQQLQQQQQQHVNQQQSLQQQQQQQQQQKQQQQQQIEYDNQQIEVQEFKNQQERYQHQHLRQQSSHQQQEYDNHQQQQQQQKQQQQHQNQQQQYRLNPSQHQNQASGRSRTVTMDSILNTVTSDESINLSDYSKVYSALNPSLMKPNRYSAPVMQNFENNLNFPSPPNTPLIMRPYRSTNHGLSKLNPISNNDQFHLPSSNQNSDRNRMQSIQSNYSIPEYTSNENQQNSVNAKSKVLISDYSSVIDLPQLFEQRHQQPSSIENRQFSFQNQQQSQHQQYNQLVHPNVQRLLSLDHNLYNEHNPGLNSNSTHFTMPPNQIQQNQSIRSYMNKHNPETSDSGVHHSDVSHQNNLYQSSSNAGMSYPEAEIYTYDENNKAIRIYKCPRPLCTKIYKNANGLKYHMENGVCEVDSSSNDATLFTDPATCDQMAMSQIKLAKRPYWCRIIGCGKKYKNLNGLKYHGKVNHPDLDFTKHVKGHHAHSHDEIELGIKHGV